ncbi:MAG: C4-type zinc ribbon domain-containing protein [Nocardioidaceae bacterium]
MDRGLVTNPKDLERMQSELVSLARRIAELEDVELDVMERLETAQNALARHEARLVELDAAAAELATSRDALTADITVRMEQTAAERKVTASGVPADLLAAYDRVRAQKGGVGAAPLRQRSCGGCSLQLNAGDLREISRAPLDEVLRCEECNRILVRTSESGI